MISDYAREAFWKFWFATGPSLILSALIFSSAIIYIVREEWGKLKHLAARLEEQTHAGQNGR